ncbi:MAG: quinolinate synthase NadA [Bacteroidales bacterium]
MTKREIIDRIDKLKKERGIEIFSHFYIEPEVQDIADYIGDSLELSKMAATTNAHTILFCGVRFMAETASIISPTKKILIPDITAGCSLADSVSPQDIIKWKEENPTGVVVSYVNTTAEVKAHTHICCTSSNAAQVIMSIPKEKKILFGPDKNLAAYIKLATGREMDIWQGECIVHRHFTVKAVEGKMELYPKAPVLIHPESSCSHHPSIVNSSRTHILSTSGMIRKAGELEADTFIVVTEPGVIYQMELLYPNKKFIAVDSNNLCRDMRKVTLEKVLYSLEKEQYVVKVPEEIREKAYPSIARMLPISAPK